MAENHTLNSGITLSHDVKVKVKKIADKYYSLSKKKIVITSGTRTAASQAGAMHEGKGRERVKYHTDGLTFMIYRG